MKRLTVITLALAAAGCADSGPTTALDPSGPSFLSSRAGVVRVTNASTAGPGSFAAAVDEANRDPAVRAIAFAPRLGIIALGETVEFRGTQDLEIDASEAALDGELLGAGAPAFRASGGGNLTIRRLTVRNAPGEGIVVDVPATSVGIKRVTLSRVVASGNGGHGVLINDQMDQDDPTNSTGSEASLRVVVNGSQFLANGFGALDRDGLRVNEGGNGDLEATVNGSRADGNGADGIEFDERGAGDVRFEVTATHVTRNGSFDQTLADLDDGFDVDEADAGSLIARVVGSSANDNKEEGFDFNENHAGDMRVELVSVEASRNLEEGIDLEEDDDFQGGGDLIVTAIGVRADGNVAGDGGLKIRERGDGNVDARVRDTETSGNLTGGTNLREQGNGDLLARIERVTAVGNTLTGIALREDDDGTQTATVKGAVTERNGSHGIDFDENLTGDLAAIVEASRSTGNTGAGVRADQQTLGVGTLLLTGVTLGTNGAGDVVTNAGVTVTQLP